MTQEMKGVFGWRGTIGFIHPTALERAAWEFYQYAPEGVALLVSNLTIHEMIADHVQRALDGVDKATELLTEMGVDFICLAGTPLSTSMGLEGTKNLLKRIEERSKVPATTTIMAAVDAFKAMSIKKIVVATPVSDALNKEKKEFFEDAGIEVLNIKGLGIQHLRDARKLPMSSAYDLAKKTYLETPEAEGIFLTCGVWGGGPVIAALENDLKKPAVVHSNQAMLWAGLKALNVREPVKGFGRLFETL